MVDYEQLAQENAIWPWLDSDCMADPCGDDWFADQNYFELEEDGD